MKKVIPISLLLSLFYGCAVHAEMEKMSGEVSLEGTLVDLSSLCTLSLTKNTVDLADYNLNSMPVEGEKITPDDAHSVGIVIQGTACYMRGIRFIGTTNAAGNALVNNLQSDASATGVGVGLYEENGQAIDIKSYVRRDLEPAVGPYPLYLGLVKLNGQPQTAGQVSASVMVQLDQL